MVNEDSLRRAFSYLTFDEALELYEELRKLEATLNDEFGGSAKLVSILKDAVFNAKVKDYILKVTAAEFNSVILDPDRVIAVGQTNLTSYITDEYGKPLYYMRTDDTIVELYRVMEFEFIEEKPPDPPLVVAKTIKGKTKFNRRLFDRALRILTALTGTQYRRDAYKKMYCFTAPGEILIMFRYRYFVMIAPWIDNKEVDKDGEK